MEEAARILRARADAGDYLGAGWQLVDLLAEHGYLEELWARAEAGDEHAADRLAMLLTKQGRGEEAERLHRFGFSPDGSIAEA